MEIFGIVISILLFLIALYYLLFTAIEHLVFKNLIESTQEVSFLKRLESYDNHFRISSFFIFVGVINGLLYYFLFQHLISVNRNNMIGYGEASIVFLGAILLLGLITIGVGFWGAVTAVVSKQIRSAVLRRVLFLILNITSVTSVVIMTISGFKELGS